MEENKISVPGAIIIAGVIIALAIFLASGKFTINTALNKTPGAPLPPTQDIAVNPVTDKDHLFGNPAAKIVVIEFSDTECPFCKLFHPTMQKIVADYKGQVAWVYRHMPLDVLHKKARKEAEATECAAELGGNDGFWKYIDRLFEITPSNDGLDPAELPKIAKEIGLDVAKFNACLSSRKYKDLVEAHLQDGIRAGVTGTPASIIINTKTGKKILVAGAESYENVKRVIEALK